MSDEPASTAAVADANEHAPHEGHEHPPDLAHHFETHEQQFDTGKMGIWVFLVTEVMFFSGLFCIYAVYRSNHPEIFQYAEQYLDKRLGALNTLVLLFSSLTAAWAVRCAQLEQRRGLIINLAITLACAFIFLGIKSIEYSHKWPVYRGVNHALTAANMSGEKAIAVHFIEHGNSEEHHEPQGTTGVDKRTIFLFSVARVDFAEQLGKGTFSQKFRDAFEQHSVKLADSVEIVPEKQGKKWRITTEVGAYIVNRETEEDVEMLKIYRTEISIQDGRNMNRFFSIYFCLTGLHAIHVIGGIIFISWLLVRSVMGHFNRNYFGPVDYVALYWHIVDLVWIYLFPLLYLIKPEKYLGP